MQSLTLNGDMIRLQKNLQTGENMSVCYSSGGGVEELYLGSNLRKVSSWLDEINSFMFRVHNKTS